MKWLIALLVVALLIAACTGGTAEQETGPIKIGYLGPLSGDLAFGGETERNALTLALEDYGTEIAGRPIEIIYEDGRCDGADATAAAQKLVNVDGVKVVLGGACSSETLAAAPITQENKVILLSSIATNPQISEAGEYVFRNCYVDDAMGPALANRIYADGFRRLAILTENTDYAIGLRAEVVAAYEALGGEVVAMEIFPPEARDFRSQIAKIRDAEPDAIFLNTQTDTTGGLTAKQVRELGLEQQFYGEIPFNSVKAREIAAGAMEGMIIFEPPGLSTEKGKALLARYQERFGEPFMEFLVGAKYDAFMIVARAMETCGEDSDCIRNHLVGLTYDGMIGTYTFLPNGDVEGIGFVTTRIENGEPVHT